MDDREPLLSDSNSRGRKTKAYRRSIIDNTIRSQNQSRPHHNSETWVEAEHTTIMSTTQNKLKMIVLVGKTGSGKSSTGNTILGRHAFRYKYCPNAVTKTCEKEEEKELSVIDTPGIFDISMTEEELRSEVGKCISMSVPGPHVFLLVIRLDVRVTEEEMNAVKWIQKNFGEDAVCYTIILFTHADALAGKSLDDYINMSSYLLTLKDTCGGRYHSFNNNEMENRSQVTELLEKIEKMVSDNGGKHYTNEMYEEAQRKIFWSKQPRFILLGKSGSGKTASVKNILRHKHDTQNLATTTCKQHEANVDGKIFRIIDTSKLIDTSVKMSADIKRFVDEFTPHVFLLVIRLDVRVIEEVMNAVKWIQKNFGGDAACYTIILFTHADALKGKSLDDYINSSYLLTLKNTCGGRYHLFNNKRMKNRSQVTELLEKIEKMVSDNGGKHYTNEMFKEAQQKIFWSEKPRIVLLGESGSGKTATRENIMRDKGNSPNSPTTTCKQHKANVDGKKIRIIDTPDLFNTSEEMKAEIKKCICMSAPGPHVFLLVIRLGVRFTKEMNKWMNTVRWIQMNFGEDALKYTIILFTHADVLRGEPAEAYIRKNNDLMSVIRSCNNRYHSFSNESRDNRDQVTQLLEKIETLAESNKWEYYTNEDLKTIIKREEQKIKVKAALSTAPGAAAVITGCVVLGVTEVVVAPAVLIAVGVVAIGVAGLFGYRRFRQWRKSRD